MRLRLIYLLAAVCLLLLVATPSAYAADVTVNCNHPKKDNSINAALATLNKQGPNTIHVSGTCNENVVIGGFYQLTLVANPGATINDPPPSAPDDVVISVFNSHVVTVDGFTINGGEYGIVCQAYSSCVLVNNTVQGASEGAVFIGRQSAAELQGGILQDSWIGLTAYAGTEVVVFGTTIQNNQDVGVWVSAHSFFRMTKPPGFASTTIQNNLNGGVLAETNSTVYGGPNAMNITANPGAGILLAEASVARLDRDNSVTNNGKGVDVGDSSFASIRSTVTMYVNTEGDNLCSGQFSNATGKFPCHTP